MRQENSCGRKEKLMKGKKTKGETRTEEGVSKKEMEGNERW